MAVKITYFVHGTTIDNEKDIASGWSDSELSELGIKQCEQLKNKIQDKKFDLIFCSDLKRSIDSAKLVFGEGSNIIQDKRLRECNYGNFNAKSIEIVEIMQEESITKRFPEGESYEDVKKRMEDFLEFLKKNHDNKNIAIVAHKAPQLALDVIIKKKNWQEAFAQDWRKRKDWQPGWDYVYE
jgi:broad specificity phosphatase PhoE